MFTTCTYRDKLTSTEADIKDIEKKISKECESSQFEDAMADLTDQIAEAQEYV